ncbi:large subunit GTPase 1 [Diutina catenulata]
MDPPQQGMNKIPLHPEKKKWKAPKGPKPVQHKNKNEIGLGRNIANRRRLENQIMFMPDGEMRFTTDKKEADWVKLRSVTQENSLDEFLNTAELADTDFTAEKQIRIIKVGQTSIVNQTGLLDDQQIEDMRRKHRLFQNNLRVPRRPRWSKEQSRIEINRQENLAFLQWRRDLAQLTESNDLLLTPFERNLEVWKQLWRVVERSDLVVQIVDARHPLFFRSIDLETYVDELSTEEVPKHNLLLVNKADLLNLQQRQAYAEYFKARGISFVFFSALAANELLEKEEEERQRQAAEAGDVPADLKELEEKLAPEEDSKPVEINDDPTHILSVGELEALFIRSAPKVEGRQLEIGLVGYPNVGKSSTINALIGSKKVSVSATPGKTKHFQTLNLSPEVMLCDCPGLVFPNFAYSNGELVCNGVLPIDQLREHIHPTSLVTQRIPKYFLEAVYGIHIPIQKREDGGNGEFPTARELLNAYARARGYMTQGFGSADEPRAARYILKDYVNGKLLYVNPPPKRVGEGVTDEDYELPTLAECRDFNQGLYKMENLPQTRQQQLVEAMRHKDIKKEEFDLSRDLARLNFSQHVAANDGESSSSTVFYGGKQAALESVGDELDRDFFHLGGLEGKSTQPFHKKSAGNGSKKHNKANKKKDKKFRVVGY